MNNHEELIRVFAKSKPSPEEIRVVLRPEDSGWAVVAIRPAGEEVLYRNPAKEVARVYAHRVPAEMYPAQGYTASEPLSTKEPLALMADFPFGRWPEVEGALRPLGLAKAKDAFVLYRGTASVAFRAMDKEVVHAAGFFDPEGPIDSLAMVLAIATLTEGRITNATGDAAASDSLYKSLRTQAHAIADDVYDLAMRLDLVPMRLNFANVAKPASAWAEVI